MKLDPITIADAADSAFMAVFPLPPLDPHALSRTHDVFRRVGLSVSDVVIRLGAAATAGGLRDIADKLEGKGK